MCNTNKDNTEYTDHSAVILRLRSLVGDKRGPGYWKFNNSLVNDTLFVSQMNSKFKDCFHETIDLNQNSILIF